MTTALNTAVVVGPSNDSWKAQAFLNLWVPKKNADGTVGKVKIGAIPLKVARNFDAKVIARLSSGGEEALKALHEVLILDFQLVSATSADTSAPF